MTFEDLTTLSKIRCKGGPQWAAMRVVLRKHPALVLWLKLHSKIGLKCSAMKGMMWNYPLAKIAI